MSDNFAADLALLTIHGNERANQHTYSLDEVILELHLLQEVVLEVLEPHHCLDARDRGVVDIGLPAMTGYALASKLRDEGFCPPSLKLIAITGYAKDADALAAARFDGYLSKPVDFEQLHQTLADAVGTRREL